MTSSQLITDTDLTFLGNIDFSHLQDARRQLITNRNGKLATLNLCIQQFVLTDVVHDKLLYQGISMLITCPVVRLNSVILKILENGCGKLAALCDNLGTSVIFDTLAGLIFSKNQQLVNKDILQILVLCLILFVNLGKDNLIAFL